MPSQGQSMNESGTGGPARPHISDPSRRHCRLSILHFVLLRRFDEQVPQGSRQGEGRAQEGRKEGRRQVKEVKTASPRNKSKRVAQIARPSSVCRVGRTCWSEKLHLWSEVERPSATRFLFSKSQKIRKNDIMRGYGSALFYRFRIFQFCNGSLHSKFPECLHMASSPQ